MPANVPLRKKIHFPPQELLIVGRQLARARGKLPAHQGIERVAEKPRRAFGVQLIEVGARAKIREQQKTLAEILREHLGCVHAGLTQEPRDMQKGPTVFLRGRRIHHDVTAAVVEHGAEVAAEACVRRGGLEAIARALELGGEPALQRIEPRIHVYH